MRINDLSLPIKGQCDRGSVIFEMYTNILDLRRWKCSICRRKSFVMGTSSEKNFVITSGKEFLNVYKWNTNIAEHYFCKFCGINTHHKRRTPLNQFGYNIGCIEGFEMKWIENIPFVDNTSIKIVTINRKNAGIEIK